MARSGSAQMSDSYYTVIRGKKYDRRMVELAEGLTSGRGDGRISIADAKNLLRVVKDANNYSPTEKLTMEYIRKHYKFTKEGDEFFRSEIRKWAARKGAGKPAKAAKRTKTSARAAAQTPAAAIPETAPQSSPTLTPLMPDAKPARSSALKQILLGLLVLLAIAALFYFIAYKSSCAKPAESAATPAAQPVEPAAAPAPAELPAPAATVPQGVAAAPSVAFGEYVEKIRLGFVAEKSELSAETLKSLDELAEKMKAENVSLRITGHTCSLGDKGFNKQISEKRAALVKEALVARGIAAERLETRGAGDSEPAGDNKTVPGRALNRRVTFTIIKK